MKKIFIIAVSALVSTTAFTALAADPPSVTKPDEKSLYKVYTNEAIGAGDKVYHITACKKAQAYVPLKCREENKKDFPEQCNPEGKNDGALIKGCKLSSKPASSGAAERGVDIPNEAPRGGDYGVSVLLADAAGSGSQTSASPYPEVDPNKYGLDKTCGGEPNNIGYYYVPEWGIGHVIGMSPDDPDSGDFQIVGTIGWPEDPTTNRKLITPIDSQGQAQPLYRATLCTTWDELAEDSKITSAKKGALEGRSILDTVKQVFTVADPIATMLIDKGCNNDNSSIRAIDVTSNKFSTPFNTTPSVSCTIKERISGTSGVDLFGKYIGGIYRWAAGVGGMIAVLIIVISGIQISASGENAENLSKAKERIMQSLIGLALLFLSGAILYAINPSFFTGG